MVLLALKAHQIEPIVDQLGTLMGPETVMVTLQNGIPWWYFQKLGGAYADRVVRAVDPNGALFSGIDPDRLIGCIAYPAAIIAEPGVIHHIEGSRFPVGELDERQTGRVRAISALFAEAGFKADVQPDQCVDTRNFGRHLPLRIEPSAFNSNDDGSQASRGEVRRTLQSRYGKTHRWCGSCRTPQDVNAARR